MPDAADEGGLDTQELQPHLLVILTISPSTLVGLRTDRQQLQSTSLSFICRQAILVISPPTLVGLRTIRQQLQQRIGLRAAASNQYIRLQQAVTDSVG